MKRRLSVNVLDLLRGCYNKKSEDDALRDVAEEIKRNPSSLNKIWDKKYYKGTLLHFSCAWNKPKVVSFLLSQQDVDVTKKFESKWKEENGLTAKQIAEMNNYSDIVALFEQYETKQAAKEPAESKIINRVKKHPINQEMKAVAEKKSAKAAAKKGAAEKAAAEKAATEKAAAEKAAAEKAAAEKAAAEKAAAEKAATEKAAAEKAAAEKAAAEKAAAEKAAAEKAATEKAATEKAAAEKAAAEKSREVRNWILEKSLPREYAQLFIENGYDSLENLCLIEEDDFKTWGVNIPSGHKKKIMIELNKLKSSSNGSSTEKVSTGKKEDNITLGSIGASSTISSMAYYRQTLSVDHSVLIISSINSGNKPNDSCLKVVHTLSQFPSLGGKLNIITNECYNWYKGWKFVNKGDPLDENEIMAIVLYTHDLGTQGEKEENFYFQLNEMLRKRLKEELNLWSGYLYYIMTGLKKLPNVQTIVYRGIPISSIDKIREEYILGRPIHWSSFSSASNKIDVAKAFAGPKGIIFRIKIYDGKNIKKYSFLPGEDETLLSPNMKFKVRQELHMEGDGYSYVDLEQKQKQYVY